VLRLFIPFMGVELARFQRFLGCGLVLFGFCSAELGTAFIRKLCLVLARLCLLEAAQIDDLSH
jgi:hypothetical protein